MIKKTIVSLSFILLVVGCFNNNNESDVTENNENKVFEGVLEQNITYTVTTDTVILDWGHHTTTGATIQIKNIYLKDDILIIEYHADDGGEIHGDAESHPMAEKTFNFENFNDVEFIHMATE